VLGLPAAERFPTLLAVSSFEEDASLVGSVVASADGGVLLFNLHVSGAGGTPAEFPDSDLSLPDQHARALFAASSPLPPTMPGYPASPGQGVTDPTPGSV